MSKRSIDTTDEKHKYAIIKLPHAGAMLEICTKKYRDIRLQVLKGARAEIAGSYEIESQLPLDHFRRLLARPDRHVVVAVLLTTPAQERNEDVALEEGEWVGCQHWIGSIPLSKYTWPNIGGLRPDSEETRWHVFGLWISPSHRGRGKQLTMKMRPVIDNFVAAETLRLLAPRAVQEGRDTLDIRWRCGVTGANRGFLQFYENIGWHVAGYVTHRVHHQASENGYEWEQEVEEKEVEVVDCAALERITHVEVRDGGLQPPARL